MNDTKNGQEQLWSQLDQMLPADENDTHKEIGERDDSAAPSHTVVQESTSTITEEPFNEVDIPDDSASEEDTIGNQKNIVDEQSPVNETSKGVDDNGTKKNDSPQSESDIHNKKDKQTDKQVVENKLACQPGHREPVRKESIPEPGGYAKPIKYRPSIKAFYPHLSVLLFTSIVFLFPSIATSLFSSQDLEQLPIFLQENLGMIVKGSMLCVSALVIFIVFKQKTSGLISVFGDYLEYKKSLIGKTTIHYADIRTIEVRRCLATSYSPIGDFHIITAKHHVVLPNLYEPFVLKEAILRRKTELKA